MNELTINLHMHTKYSDGSGTHAELGEAALKTGVDVIIVTDHNTLVQGMDGYQKQGSKRVLILVGEEIHDQDRVPQKNHLLVFNARQDLASFADDPQVLLGAVQRAGGLSFIAHPVDPEMPAFGETDISWVDWNVTGFTGLELWNSFSEFKTVAKGRLDAIFYAFFPRYLPHGPLPKTLAIWDGLLASGRRVVAVGGSDAHALHLHLGPIRKIIFPYEYHFSCINTHTLIPAPLTHDLETDRRTVFEALAAGHCYVGYDLPAPTRGFRFSAHTGSSTAIMGDEVALSGSVTLQAKLPSPADVRLVKDGISIKEMNTDTLTFIASEPGVYRIEASRQYLGQRRGWIFSNPIYVRLKPQQW